MNTVLLICAIIVTVTVVTAAVFLINTLVQMKRTAKEAEVFLNGVNGEVDKMKNMTNSVSGFIANLVNSPWLKFGSVISAVATNIFAASRRNQGPDRKN